MLDRFAPLWFVGLVILETYSCMTQRLFLGFSAVAGSLYFSLHVSMIFKVTKHNKISSFRFVGMPREKLVKWVAAEPMPVLQSNI